MNLKNASDESITDEIKVLGSNYVKNFINFAMEQIDKLITVPD